MLGLELKVILICHHTSRIVHLDSILLLNSNYSKLTSTPAGIKCSVLQRCFSTQHGRVQTNQISYTVLKESFVFLAEPCINSPVTEMGIYLCN